MNPRQPLTPFLASLDAEAPDDSANPYRFGRSPAAERSARAAQMKEIRRMLRCDPEPPAPPVRRPAPVAAAPARYPTGRPPITKWASVNWSDRDAMIARKLGATLAAVGRARRRFGVAVLPAHWLAGRMDLNETDLVARWRGGETMLEIAAADGITYGMVQRTIARHTTAEEREHERVRRAGESLRRHAAICAAARSARQPSLFRDVAA